MAEAFNLSMIAARSPVVSFCDDLIVDDENGPDRGIRARLTKRLPRLVECSAHELFVSVGCHDARKSNNTCLEGFEPPTF